MRHLLAITLFLAIAATSHAIAATIVKKEPPMGALKQGQVVLVDDGSCPAGQIKQVTGGNHVRGGGYKTLERERSCVPR